MGHDIGLEIETGSDGIKLDWIGLEIRDWRWRWVGLSNCEAWWWVGNDWGCMLTFGPGA